MAGHGGIEAPGGKHLTVLTGRGCFAAIAAGTRAIGVRRRRGVSGRALLGDHVPFFLCGPLRLSARAGDRFALGLIPGVFSGRVIGALFHYHLRVCAGTWYRTRCAVCRKALWCRDTAGVFDATSVPRVAGSRVYKETVTGWNDTEITVSALGNQGALSR